MFCLCVRCCRGTACLLLLSVFSKLPLCCRQKLGNAYLEPSDSTIPHLLQTLTNGCEQLSVKWHRRNGWVYFSSAGQQALLSSRLAFWSRAGMACDCWNPTCVCGHVPGRGCSIDKGIGRIFLLEKLACNVWGRVILQRDTVSISSTLLILSWSQEGQMLPNLLLSQVLP